MEINIGKTNGKENNIGSKNRKEKVEGIRERNKKECPPYFLWSQCCGNMNCLYNLLLVT
jgi:hypothetical protein